MEDSMHLQFGLRQWLTIPYVVLIMAVVVLIGSLSYREGSRAVDTMADRLLLESVRHVSLRLAQHLTGSSAVLDVAFPAGLPVAERIENDLPGFRRRLWAATSLNLNPNNSVFFGNESGQSVAVFRFDANKGELRLREGPDSVRMAYPMDGIDSLQTKGYAWGGPMDTRTRPWYKAAKASQTAIWTPVYADFHSKGLVITRARKVLSADGSLRGVVATDIPLNRFNDFMQSIRVSPNAVAFVLDDQGILVASSQTGNAINQADGGYARLHVADAGSAVQAQAFSTIQGGLTGAMREPWAGKFQMVDGRDIHLAVSHMGNAVGLNWWVAVTVPKSDFTGEIGTSVLRTAGIGVGASFVALCIGLLILEGLSADLLKLTDAVKGFRIGRPGGRVKVRTRGEIGMLACAFEEMQQRLCTDALTGLYNRETALRLVDERVARAVSDSSARDFAVLFVDLDNFKLVNDQYGHDGGDKVLVEMAKRLRDAARPGDMVARYAGDEFVVLLDQVSNPEQAEQLRAQFEARLAARLVTVDLGTLAKLCTGGTVGLACYQCGIEASCDLIALADQDMYRRKVLRDCPTSRRQTSAVVSHLPGSPWSEMVD